MEEPHDQLDAPSSEPDETLDLEDQELMNILAGTDVDKLLADEEAADHEPLPTIDDDTLVEVVDGPAPTETIAQGETDASLAPPTAGPPDQEPELTQDDLDELLRQAGALAEPVDQPNTETGEPTGQASPIDPGQTPQASEPQSAPPAQDGQPAASIEQLDEMLADRASAGEVQADAASDVPPTAGPPPSSPPAKTVSIPQAAVQGVTAQEAAAIASDQSTSDTKPPSPADTTAWIHRSQASLSASVKSVLAYLAFALLVASALLALKALLMPA